MGPSKKKILSFQIFNGRPLQTPGDALPLSGTLLFSYIIHSSPPFSVYFIAFHRFPPFSPLQTRISLSLSLSPWPLHLQGLGQITTSSSNFSWSATAVWDSSFHPLLSRVWFALYTSFLVSPMSFLGLKVSAFVFRKMLFPRFCLMCIWLIWCEKDVSSSVNLVWFIADGIIERYGFDSIWFRKSMTLI